MFLSAFLWQAFWVIWYDYISLLSSNSNVAHLTFMNYGFSNNSEHLLNLTYANDIFNRYEIQLYEHVLQGQNLTEASVLELSSGRGGAAEYITRTKRPKYYLGIDISKNAIQFCNTKHVDERPNIEFMHGDVQKLPIDNDVYDYIINVEASHCYPNFTRFLLESARVLKPNGTFFYADFRPNEKINEWLTDIQSVYHIVDKQIINNNVLLGLDRMNEKHVSFVKFLPFYLHWFGYIFTGTMNSTMYNNLKHMDHIYMSFVLRPLPKPDQSCKYT